MPVRNLDQDPISELEREMIADRITKMTRRGMVMGAAGIGALAATLGVGRGNTAASALASVGLLPEDLPAKNFRAATVEVLGASTWVSHGIETAAFYGSLLGIDVQSFDGEGAAENQLAQLEAIANEDWDFVAVHPASSDALIDGADAIIAKGVPFIVMDTRLIQDEAAFSEYGHLTYIEPDNIYMGSTVAVELFKAIGGEGQVIHTQGALGHTGAQGRAAGFNQAVANYPGIEVVDETPANWLQEEASTLWQDLLQRYPDVKGGYFHSDDMALAAQAVVESAGLQDQVKLVGVDGLKNACQAILDDKLTASVINPSGRIHGGAIWAGYLTVSQTDNSDAPVPKFIRADGGPITKSNAAGYIWLHDNYQY
ncbi:MAG: ABC transporter, substrate-binding protein (cluster 2, ribose/xylose/arabinose/galactose) [uncultured Thermomicrobiales bacterium]|uniref:ABC transporter, substrate-binding protein (Cluster 2, ribose/xylose/arabinose/galactose) n=1 Tax=uncultured Thermomicrobiales bacterium TaxID=1645740 RepID=A0A6J4UBZ0_9BACT|nr:MAG: ABC transporter, substrate-binding protein (cluster 2, ribose/xylose/arabinose/galactose) [uncultured Thermomicrobiales bacterium]